MARKYIAVTAYFDTLHLHCTLHFAVHLFALALCTMRFAHCILRIRATLPS